MTKNVKNQKEIERIENVIKHIMNHRKVLEAKYNREDFSECLLILNKCASFPKRFATLCLNLQDDLIYSLLEITSDEISLEELTQMKSYFQEQCRQLEKQKEQAKERYNRFMFHLSDNRILTKAGREYYNYNSQVMADNLRYQDLKFTLASYFDGFHADKLTLHMWLLTIINHKLS